jgi:hypothetical protein
MLKAQKRQRAQVFLLVCGIIIITYYFVVVHHLSKHASAPDQALGEGWKQLADAALEIEDVTQLDIAGIEQKHTDWRQAVTELEVRAQGLSDRMNLASNILKRIEGPFILLEFQAEHQRRLEEMAALLKQKKVRLGFKLLDAFPEYATSVKQPNMLWAQLSLVHHLLALAAACEVEEITKLELRPNQSFHAADDLDPFLEKYSAYIELISLSPKINKFLLSLPLLPAEIEANGLPEAPPTKPVMLIDEILLQKNSTNQNDAALLKLTASGFYYRR